MSIGALAASTPPGLEAIVADPAAFREWYDQVLPRVYGYLLSRCGHDESLAEELTQQTFVDAIRRRAQFDGRSDVVTWLCAIGRHKLVDHFRRVERERRGHLRVVEGWTDADADQGAWHQSEAAEAVEAALARLSGEQRTVLVLRYLDGMAVREIARLVGRSEKATESLLSRSRDAFRRAYGA